MANTEIVADNAFNPDYMKSDFTLDVRDSLNSYLLVTVWDYNTGADELIGHWCCPVSCLRSGLRVLKLLDSNFEHIERGMCHVLATLEKK